MLMSMVGWRWRQCSIGFWGFVVSARMLFFYLLCLSLSLFTKDFCWGSVITTGSFCLLLLGVKIWSGGCKMREVPWGGTEEEGDCGCGVLLTLFRLELGVLTGTSFCTFSVGFWDIIVFFQIRWTDWNLVFSSQFYEIVWCLGNLGCGILIAFFHFELQACWCFGLGKKWWLWEPSWDFRVLDPCSVRQAATHLHLELEAFCTRELMVGQCSIPL